MWALFAIGELRSSRCPSSTNKPPGLAYFAAASDAVRMVNERPQLGVIETLLLLVSFPWLPVLLTSSLTYSHYWLCILLKPTVGIPRAPM